MTTGPATTRHQRRGGARKGADGQSETVEGAAGATGVLSAAAYRALNRRGNKYHAVRSEEDGYTFDSLRERRRYLVLRARLIAGEITDLTVHPAWELVVNGQKISRFTGDFSYREAGALVVEDVKAAVTKTRAYVIRKKLMKALHGITITEV